MNLEFETHNTAKAPETYSALRTVCYCVRSWEPMKSFMFQCWNLDFFKEK